MKIWMIKWLVCKSDRVADEDKGRAKESRERQMIKLLALLL